MDENNKHISIKLHITFMRKNKEFSKNIFIILNNEVEHNIQKKDKRKIILNIFQIVHIMNYLLIIEAVKFGFS